MSTFVLIHGGGDVGWSWHLVEAELRALGHEVVAPDLPADDDSLTLDDYAAAVIAAVGERRNLIVVAHSFGGFTAPLVAVRLPAEALAFVAGMVPRAGESPGDWWERTHHGDAVKKQAARDGGVTGNDDPYVSFYHDVPRELASEALSKERAHPSTACWSAPWPLRALPEIPTHFVLCTEDRIFPAEFMRNVVRERLGVEPDEIRAGHCVALSRPKELAALLHGYAQALRPRLRIADHYDAELAAYDARLRGAVVLRPSDRVLDVGCGAGKTTRDAARAIRSGSALGIDVSEPMLERARRLGAEERLRNVAFECGDAEVHPLSPSHFDCILSRFGTMFFADPAAAFANFARAARPGSRLVLLVWQSEAKNPWATEIRRALADSSPPRPGLDPFSQADPDELRALLEGAGFVDVELADVREPVFYGSDASAALDLVRDMSHVRARLAQLPAAQAEQAVARLRETLAAHETSRGVQFDARAWLVTARAHSAP